jgi:hypothetical protein
VRSGSPCVRLRRAPGWALAAALIAAFITSACASPSSDKARRASALSENLAGAGFSPNGWKTDFSKHSVSLGEISSGGPPRDGIPPLDHPRFVTPQEATKWLKGREPVIALDLDGAHRAYPLQILIWHEIVNDQVAGVPVTVTFCPLCDTAIAFDRRVDGRTLDFGTSGNLRKSDLVMWDRQTESWWQQATGTAIVGALTGTVLSVFPAAIVSFDTFREAYPDGSVLSRDTGFDRIYGENPYPGYDDARTPPFLFKGPTDGRLPPKEKVVSVSIGGDDVAYPYSVLQKRGVVPDAVGGTPIAVFYQAGTASALGGSSIPDSPDGGATGVFKSRLGDHQLTFRASGNRFVDAETGSSWDLLGRAVSGPLAGSHLEAVVHGDHFWFAWAAFKPSTRIYKG